MDGRLDQALADIETACAGIDAALGAGDWQAAGQGNADLDARVACLETLLVEPGLATAGAPFAVIAARLQRVLAHHGSLAVRLRAERDDAGAELAHLRTGRRGTTHYLDTAEG